MYVPAEIDIDTDALFSEIEADVQTTVETIVEDQVTDLAYRIEALEQAAADAEDDVPDFDTVDLESRIREIEGILIQIRDAIG